jgi:hypothetical protein
LQHFQFTAKTVPRDDRRALPFTTRPSLGTRGYDRNGASAVPKCCQKPRPKMVHSCRDVSHAFDGPPHPLIGPLAEGLKLKVIERDLGHCKVYFATLHWLCKTLTGRDARRRRVRFCFPCLHKPLSPASQAIRSARSQSCSRSRVGERPWYAMISMQQSEHRYV